MLGLRRQKNIAGNESGVTAVEFALIAPLFFAFILGIMDIAIYFFVSGQLQHGVVQAARAVRTGNLVGSNAAARDAFRQAVCDRISAGIIGTCTDTILIDVRSFNSYAAITVPSINDMDALANGGNEDGVITDGETTFTTGGPSCPVFVRGFFRYTTIIPGLQHFFAAVVPGTVYITAATVFRNEPFTGGVTLSCATAGDLM